MMGRVPGCEGARLEALDALLNDLPAQEQRETGAGLLYPLVVPAQGKEDPTNCDDGQTAHEVGFYVLDDERLQSDILFDVFDRNPSNHGVRSR
jgi:hypothetical protein